MSGTTLLITTRDRGRLLDISLQRLNECWAIPDQLIVVDDGGDDDTEEVCRRYERSLPIEYIYLDNPGVTLCSRARNVGVKAATGDIIITSEPECIFLTNVIEQMLAAHKANRNKVISAGTIYVARAENQLDHTACELREGWVAPYAALYRRAWLMAVRGWDEEFPGSWGWDDTDLLTRLRGSGYGQVIDREIKLLHQWHEPNMEDQSANEAHFRSKSFHQSLDERGWADDLIANKGIEWGRR